jgi:hypothetical protein
MPEKPEILHSSILEFLNTFFDNKEIIDHLLNGLSEKFDAGFTTAMTQLSDRYERLRDSLQRDSLSGKWPLVFPPSCLDNFALVDMQLDVNMPPINHLKTTIYFDENNKVQVGYELDGEPLDRKGFSLQEVAKIRKYLDACYLEYLQKQGVELKDGNFYKGGQLIDAETFKNTYFTGSESAYRSAAKSRAIDIRDPSFETVNNLSRQESEVSSPK